MPIILNIIAIASGVVAFVYGPDRPRRMFIFGGLAAVLFVCATFMYPPRAGISGCFIDWDGRSNSEICD